MNESLRSSQGFTLVEILVVLVIIGITVGMVRFNAIPGDQDILQSETTRFSLLVEQAANEARASGRAYACVITPYGYYFQVKRDDGQWIDVSDTIFRAREWPEGLRVTGLEIDGQKAVAEQRILFSSSGYNSAFTVRFSMGTYRREVIGSMSGRVYVS